MTIKNNAIPNLQQISKSDSLPLGKFFDDLKSHFGDKKIRILPFKREPMYIKSPVDGMVLLHRNADKDCGCSLKLHVAKPRTMMNVLKIEAKRHNKRKGSKAYHTRIQKKWDKRVLKEGSDCKLAVKTPAVISMTANFSKLLIGLESA